MIGKHIRRVKGKPTSFARLNDYITLAQREDEKIAYVGTKNLVSLETASAEMAAAAHMNTRCKDPVFHALLSWRAGEQPSYEQVDEAVGITMKELGLEECQAVYALHKNTVNVHVHISINRVHPETYKAIDAGQGWSIKSMERAARMIEARQGWEIEKNPWSVVENGMILTIDSDENEKKIRAEVKDKENLYGEKSAERIAKEFASKLIDSSKSWEQLHKKLAENGMRYEKKGSGALIYIGDVPVKASSAGKKYTMNALEKRLGVYEECFLTVEKSMNTRAPEPVEEAKKINTEWSEYTKSRHEYYRNKMEKKNSLREKHALEREMKAKKHREERAELFSKSWKGRGQLLNAMRSVMAGEQLEERIEMKEKQALERREIEKNYPRFPSFEDWLREQKGQEKADEWKYRRSDEMEGEKDVSPKKQDIRDFKAYISNIKGRTAAVYFRKTEPEKIAFVDSGKVIKLHEKDDATLLAALQLSAQKWGSVQLNGSDEYKKRCIELAVKNNIKISNPELQDVIRLEKEERSRRAERVMNSKESKASKELDKFREYSASVGADRYRVTAITMLADGKPGRGFILDKNNAGFTAEEMEGQINRLVGLQNNKNMNIYYTPISEKTHHILVDDMDSEALGLLIADGHEPAVIIESSPGNYQAVINVPKLESEHDREIGNTITKKLNKEYGDPKLSGAVHAHRAPGFENRKPKHEKDGVFPEVKITDRQQKKQISQKDLEESRNILMEITEREKQRAKQLELDMAAQKYKKTPAVPMGDLARAYRKHFHDIKRLHSRQQRAELDMSRVDAMVAIRMRITGHSQKDVEMTIKRIAPELRFGTGGRQRRNWDDYAKRTAEYAFSGAGDREIEKFTKQYKEHWMNIEKPAVVRRDMGR